jgi:hypothetical protein
MAVVHFAATPTRRLPHPEKVRAEQRHIAMLTGVLGAVLLLLLPRREIDRRLGNSTDPGSRGGRRQHVRR